MPPRKRAATVDTTTPSTMKELESTLWKAADKLRGSLAAHQYKDVILGLVFLKYVSDAYDERREAIRAELQADGLDDEQIADLIDDPEEYQGYGVFVVPPEARWTYLAEHARGKEAAGNEPKRSIGYLIDEAMKGISDANDSLKGTLVARYNRDGVDQRRLGELIDLFNSARFTRQGAGRARDLMGEVYEYFLGNFARAEGRRGGEFFTPPSVVKTLVEIVEPRAGRIYDPCCGSGGMFVQAEKFIDEHNGDRDNVAVYGQEAIEETWRMAKMNLAIHGIDHDRLGTVAADTFAIDQHAGVEMDYVLANPPFNIKDWTRSVDDPRWAFGAPPANNANYAWIQHIISKLAPGGKAGVVMANGSMSSQSNGEGDIRAKIVTADLVSCMVALPTQLFRSTGIPVCLWFFTRGKRGAKWGSTDRTGQVLFIDAREMGYMVDRAERALSDDDIVRIGDTFRTWRGMPALTAYKDVSGFCKSVTVAEIKAADYALGPGRYVGAADVAVDGEPINEKVKRLKKELFETIEESARRDAAFRAQLERLDV